MAKYRVKGSDKPEDVVDTIQCIVVVSIAELAAAENPAAYLTQAVLGSAAELLTVWEANKDNIELVPEEGQ